MRTLPALALSLFLGLLCTASAWSQPPGPPGGGGQGGGGGSMGGGFRFGRGQGMGRRNFDPGSMFDRWANGKNYITRADVSNPWMQQRFDQLVQQLGVTNGQLTRDQFVSAMQQGGFGGGRAGGGGASGGQDNGNGPPDTSAWAENAFRRLDTNGDGVLNNDEMPEELKAERDKWDTDKNGLIDLNEFKAYFEARMQQWRQDRNSQGNGPPPLFVPGVEPDPPEPEVQKPVAYRVGKLPKELPEWFQQLDTDGDAQIGLYEWKASGRPLDEFFKMDRNGDGFLTVQEVLYYMANQKNGNGAAGNPPGIGGPPGGQDRTSFFNGPGRNGNGGRNRGGNGNGGRRANRPRDGGS